MNFRLPHLILIGVVLVLALWIGSYERIFGLLFLATVGLSALRLRYPRSLHGLRRNEYAAESRTQRRRRSIQQREEELQREQQRRRKGL